MIETSELELLLLHYCLGYIPFNVLEKLYPSCTQGVVKLN
jgi:hypothetical protein